MAPSPFSFDLGDPSGFGIPPFLGGSAAKGLGTFGVYVFILMCVRIWIFFTNID